MYDVVNLPLRTGRVVSIMVVCQYFLKGDCRFGDKCRYEHPSAKAKTVCSYFLDGFCRFGDKCRNEHPRGLGSSSGGFRQTSRSTGQWNSSYCNQNRFEALSNKPRESSDSEQTISQIQQTMKNDLEIWERSRQWPLSCYTYTKEEPSLPGLMDFSPEEIRLEAYTANAKGNADIYEQGLKQLISENLKRRHQLSKMTVAQIQKEIQKNAILYQLEPVAMDAGSSVQQTSTGMLSGSGSFSSQSGTGPLGQSSGLFGAGNPTNQSGHNIFGQTSLSSANLGSLFGSSDKSTDQNVQLNQSGGLFGVGLLGQAPTTGSKFGSVPTATSSGVFGTASKPQKDDSSVSNCLNMAASLQKSNIGTTSSVANPSKVALERQTLTCSERDMQAFMADSFVLGKIPECPPPLDLC